MKFHQSPPKIPYRMVEHLHYEVPSRGKKIHIALLSKAHPSLFASEGLFVRVDHLVGFEVALGGELGGALVTCKWFLIGVDLKRVKE